MLESYKTLLGVVENRGSRAANAIKEEYVEHYSVDEIGAEKVHLFNSDMTETC